MTKKHPLAAWMDGHKEISQAQFADDCDCSESHLSLIMSGKRGVSLNLAKKLSDATNGDVRVEDFLRDPERASQ